MECGEQLAPLRAARARALQQSFGFRWVTWRWRWDSNPRWCYPHTLSRRAPLAARTRHRRRGYRSPADPGSPAGREEPVEQRGALLGPHATHDLGPVVETAVAHEVPHRAGG